MYQPNSDKNPFTQDPNRISYPSSQPERNSYQPPANYYQFQQNLLAPGYTNPPAQGQANGTTGRASEYLMIDIPADQARINERNQQQQRENLNTSLSISRSCSGLALVINIAKIGLGIYIIIRFLNDPPGECPNNFLYWFIGMLVHDLINFYLLMKGVIINSKLKRLINNPQEFVRESQANGRRSNTAVVEYLDRLQVEKEKLKNDEHCLDFLYLMLLVWGNITYVVAGEGCTDEFILIVARVFIIMAYCVIMMPIIACCGLCLCFPCIICLLRNLPALQQGPAPARSTANLKVKKAADMRLEGEDAQCGICLCDYEPTEEIISLPCNSKHNFHKDCISKWLKINGSCPQCRKRVDDPN